MKYSVIVKFNNGWSESDVIELDTQTEKEAFDTIVENVMSRFEKKGKVLVLTDYHGESKSFYFEELNESKW